MMPASDDASDRSYSGSVRYRVDELAAAAGVTVDTVRFYQARGLLARPERDGRVVWYGEEHVQRLARIRELKARGFPLALIARVLSGELDTPGQALAIALADPLPGEEERLDLDDLATRTGASLSLLEALEREGLLVGRAFADLPYTAADLDTVRAGLALLAAGIPLSELLALARAHDDAMRAVADAAVDLFARYIYDPLRDAGTSEQLVETLQYLLPAAEALVSHHFRRRLLAAAGDRLAG
jgi:DNA-binding transcriptional MerR regulator